MASLKSYGKLDESDQQRLKSRQKTRKRIVIMALSSIILIGVIVAAVVGTSQAKEGSSRSEPSLISASIKAACDTTLYPGSCYTSLAPLVNSSQVQPEEIYKLSVQVARNELLRVAQYFSENEGYKEITDKMAIAALESCRELLGLALDHLNISLATDNASLLDAVDDLETWLSAAGTFQQTCIDGFDNTTNALKISVFQNLKNSTEFTSNSLALLNTFLNIASSLKERRLLSLPLREKGYLVEDVVTRPKQLFIKTLAVLNRKHTGGSEMPNWLSPIDRKLLQSTNSTIKADVVERRLLSLPLREKGYLHEDVVTRPKRLFIKTLAVLNRKHTGGSEMPNWLSLRDRKLLQSTNSTIKADVVVAKDGSGKYTTIGDAMKAAPDTSTKRFVIYVKKGVYNENVRVEKTKWNVMVIGDGMNATVVSGSLNFVDGTPTFSTATFAVFGQGFIARDMGFLNIAGAIKQQAVALMSTSDLSVFYRCRVDAFQDTLYTLSNRQFYSECNIYGTVDFIFGNSAVVFQNCNILPKVPIPGQQNTITAQGKIDPNQNTGISIQNCTIGPSENLSSVQTFLGRPWKNHSTTVYINTMMGSLIDPKGWLPWVGTTAPDTIFYAEFQNFGLGSSTKNRVKWKGLRNITSKQASTFTVKSFINGNKWIPMTGISYKPGL
ncbi:unnamed protein product [Ilex paraguariensis]|uniref:Pectinesterase n=1 Tax=Ilex paraguariensis TaxID=185542 RepID=A0ABC8T4C6_9AQUA